MALVSHSGVSGRRGIDLDPKLLAGIIAAIAGIVGAALGAFAKGYSSRQKLKELEFDYERRLNEGYIERAREYLSSVYLPLSISLTKLNSAFISFREKPTVQAEQNRFKASIKEFVKTVDQLGSQGANAFYTTDLDEALQSFRQFVSASVTATETNIKGVLKTSMGPLPFVGGMESERNLVLKGKRIERYRTTGEISVGFWKFRFTYRADEVLSSPVNTVDFEERFVRDIYTINVLVKEVTLGSKARASKQSSANNAIQPTV